MFHNLLVLLNTLINKITQFYKQSSKNSNTGQWANKIGEQDFSPTLLILHTFQWVEKHLNSTYHGTRTEKHYFDWDWKCTCNLPLLTHHGKRVNICLDPFNHCFITCVSNSLLSTVKSFTCTQNNGHIHSLTICIPALKNISVYDLLLACFITKTGVTTQSLSMYVLCN
jgi:hypothetical protein